MSKFLHFQQHFSDKDASQDKIIQDSKKKKGVSLEDFEMLRVIKSCVWFQNFSEIWLYSGCWERKFW